MWLLTYSQVHGASEALVVFMLTYSQVQGVSEALVVFMLTYFQVQGVSEALVVFMLTYFQVHSVGEALVWVVMSQLEKCGALMLLVIQEEDSLSSAPGSFQPIQLQLHCQVWRGVKNSMSYQPIHFTLLQINHKADTAPRGVKIMHFFANVQLFRAEEVRNQSKIPKFLTLTLTHSRNIL